MAEQSRQRYSFQREAIVATFKRAEPLPFEGIRVVDVPPPETLSRDDLAAKARAILKGRRARDRVFGGSDMFGEPAWDMMLDMFVAETDGERVTVSSAAAASNVAPTTGLRWIDKLVRLGLFEREADPFDRRRQFLRLSERADKLVRLAITVS